MTRRRTSAGKIRKATRARIDPIEAWHPTGRRRETRAKPEPRTRLVSRSEALRQLARLINGRFVLVDTESTGVGRDAQAIEIGILGDCGAPLLEMVRRPTVPIHPEASRVHGFTEADLADVEPWSQEDLMQVQGQLTGIGGWVVGYNAAFDRRILIQTFRAAGLETAWIDTDVDWLCAMTLRQNIEETTRPRPLDGGHRAIDDCYATLRMLLAIHEGRRA